MSTDVSDAMQDLIRLRQLHEIVSLDYRRGLRAVANSGVSQREIAQRLRVTQPTISAVLRKAQDLPQVAEGFSGAGPAEICQRYAAGLISRDQLIDELARWPYTPVKDDDPYDWLVVTPPGSWEEVTEALYEGWIDDDIYDEVAHRREQRRKIEPCQNLICRRSLRCHAPARRLAPMLPPLRSRIHNGSPQMECRPENGVRSINSC